MKKTAIIVAAISILWVAVQIQAQQQTVQGKQTANTKLNVKKTALAQSVPQGLSFVSLSVGPIGLGCSRTNPVTMRNNSTQTIASNQYKIKYWSRASSSQQWDHYYGGSLASEFAPGETKSFDMHFSVPLNATEIRMTVNPDFTNNSPIICEVSAPVTQLPVDQIKVTAQFSANGWTVTIANNSSMYFCSDNMSTFKATAAAPNTWIACGGTMPPQEIAPGKQGTISLSPGAGWKTGYKFFKVVLYYGTFIYKEQVLPIED